MPDTSSNFVKVADLKDVPEGTPKAVKVEGRSIALFQHQGNVYATDNQCPHMGYPLPRRVIFLERVWPAFFYSLQIIYKRVPKEFYKNIVPKIFGRSEEIIIPHFPDKINNKTEIALNNRTVHKSSQIKS